MQHVLLLSCTLLLAIMATMLCLHSCRHPVIMQHLSIYSFIFFVNNVLNQYLHWFWQHEAYLNGLSCAFKQLSQQNKQQNFNFSRISITTKKHDSPGLCMSEGWVHVTELMYSKYDFQYNEARGWQEDHICFPTYRMFRNICCNIPKFVTLRLIFRSGSYVNFSREHSRQMLLF